MIEINGGKNRIKIKKNKILLNNLGSKHSLLIKFDQFMTYYKRKNFIKKF